MAKKKKPEEHENLERWLVSYADFMTLLFATFVVLYALSQINVNEFKKVEESIKKAFTVHSVFDNGSGLMTGNNSLLDSSSGDSVIDTLLLEYISPRYEQESYDSIKKQIDDMKKSGELKAVSANIDERGLVIILDDENILFSSGSADLSVEAKKKLEIVGKLIVEKFAMHTIKIEGHTDKVPAGGRYPSNWELSGARASSIVRFLIDRFKILPDLFVAVGYADTRPAVPYTDKDAYKKNRRVEIVVQRNQHKRLDHYQNTFMKLDRAEQQRRRNEQIQIIKEIDNRHIQSLGEDIDFLGIGRNGQISDDFIEESKRVENLSNPE